VTGRTASSGWVSGGFDTSHSGGDDGFVAKLTPTGQHLWSTYLGGSSNDAVGGIAVDATGNYLVTGYTQSSGWVSGGFDTSHNGGVDALVAKLTPTGQHLWSTYLGGSSNDYGNGIAVDAAGNCLVTGRTASSGWVSGGFDTSHNGGDDAFVAKILDPTTIVIERPATAVSGWWQGLDANDISSSAWANEGGLVLGPGISESQPVYRFLLPPPTMGCGQLENLTISLYGKGDFWTGEPELLLGPSFATSQGDLPEAEDWHPYSFTGADARILLEPIGAPYSGYMLNVMVDTGMLDWYDLKELRVTYEYSGLPRVWLEGYQVSVGAAKAIFAFDEDVGARWGQNLELNAIKDATQKTISFALSLIPFATADSFTDALHAFDTSLKELLDLLAPLQSQAEWVSFLSRYTVDLNEHNPHGPLQDAFNALLPVSEQWLSSMDDGVITDSEAVTLNSKIHTALTNLSLLEAALSSVVSWATEVVHDDQNPAMVNCAKVVIKSLSPLMQYDPDTGNLRTDVQSYLPALRDKLQAQVINLPPTDVMVSQSTVAENQPTGTVVGTLSTADLNNPTDTFSYALVSGTGSTDNSSFVIVGNSLVAAATFDYEVKNSYSIRVRTTDAGALSYEKILTIAVGDVNLPPTNIGISSANVQENRPSGTVVGSFSTTDNEPPAAPFIYSLVAGDGSADNASFSIVGNSLRTAASFNYELKSTYSVRVRATDQGGLYREQIFTIHVLDVLEVFAEAGGPYYARAGQDILLDGSGSTDLDNDIVKYEWDLDNDGQYDDKVGMKVPFQAAVDGVFTVGLRVTDAYQESNTDTAAVNVDSVAPTITTSPPSGTITRNGPITYTVTYADAHFNVSTLSAANITLNRTGTANGTVSVGGTGMTRTVTISNITGDGSLGITIAGGTASDLAGNLAAAAGPTSTFTVDNTLPTISISAPSTQITTGAAVTYTVTYSDSNLNGITLTAANVILNRTGSADGSVSVTGSGPTRTVTISNITGDGALEISIAAGTASDLAGNLAPGAGPSSTFGVDSVPLALLPIQRMGANPTNADSVRFVVAFTEDVTGVDPSDFALALTGSATGAAAVSVTGSGAGYRVTVHGVAGNGTLGLDLVDDGTITDMYGNHFRTAEMPQGQVYTIDTAPPTVLSINRNGMNPINATSLRFTVAFSEGVTGVDAGDFGLALTGLPGTVTSISGIGATYTVTVDLTGSGTATAGLNLADNNSVVDAAGNPLGGPTAGDGDFTGQVYNVDTALKVLMYWLKPVAGGTGDYTVNGSFTGGDQNAASAYTVSVNSLPTGPASIKFELHASIGGKNSSASDDYFVSGILDVLNTPAAGSALAGQPNPVTLAAGLDGTNSSGGTVTRDIDGLGGLDLGGNLSIGLLPGTGEAWVRPYNPSSGVAGTAVNYNGWTDILLGTFTYTYGAAGGVLGGQSAQLRTAAVTYTGGGSGKFAEFWRQDGSSQRESDGSKIGAGPSVTIAVKPLVSIGSVSLPEGDETTDFVFPVTLSMPCAQPVQVTVDTADGTATVAGNDYQGLHQVLTFAPGETSKMATVHVLGNTLLENDETFSISLSNVTGAGASLAVGAATATIHNDDGTVLLGNGGASVAIACNPGDPTHGTADLFLGGSLTPTYSVATTRFSQFHIVGGAGLDQVTLDFGQGNPLPAQGLVFDEAPGKTGDILAWQNMTGPVLVSPAGITDSSLRPVVAHNVSFREFAFANAPNNRLTIDGTALTIGRDNAISANAAVEIVHGGLLDLGNKTDVVQSLVLTDGRVINGELQSASHTLAQGEVSANLTGGRLVKSGPGTAIISGQNGYTGGTEVESDVLLVASVGALPRGGDVTIGPGATLALQRDLNLAAAARTIAASAAQVSRAGTSGPPAPSVGRGSSAPVQTDMMCQPSPPAIAPLPTTICEFRTEPTALQALAPAAVKAVAEPAARADLRPASLRVRAARLAVKDAAIALRQAAQIMPDASWLALIEHAIRLQRSSEKTGQAQALVDEVLARYGL
jgi:autotransporter-associated beta strand protein